MTGSGAVEPLRLSDEIYHFTENGIIPTDGQLVMLGIKAEDLEAQVAELREQIELDDEQHQKEITDISNKNGELQTKLWQIQETFGDLEKRAEAAEESIRRAKELTSNMIIEASDAIHPNTDPYMKALLDHKIVQLKELQKLWEARSR